MSEKVFSPLSHEPELTISPEADRIVRGQLEQFKRFEYQIDVVETYTIILYARSKEEAQEQLELIEDERHPTISGGIFDVGSAGTTEVRIEDALWEDYPVSEGELTRSDFAEGLAYAALKETQKLAKNNENKTV